MHNANLSDWHLLGAGSIGTLFAAAMSQAKITPTLILRHADHERTRLTLMRDNTAFKFEAATEAADIRAPIRQLLITTKSYQCLSALETVAHRLASDATLVVLHNGYGPQQQIAERWPRLRVYAGTTTEGAYRQDSHSVVHAGHGDTWLGPINDRAIASGQAAIAPLLELDLRVGYTPDINTRLWQKLALNAAINGLTVIHDCQNGRLASDARIRQQMATLCTETESIAAALNQPLFDEPLLQRAVAVAEATGSNYSSMLQDVRHGRPTELDSINGTLCRLAAQYGIDAPAHRWLVDAVTQKANALSPG